MSVLDANFGSPPESSVSAAWVEHERASILADGKQFTLLNVGTEPSWSGGVSLENKSFKPGICSFKNEDNFARNLARLGFASPDVLAFDQEAPSRAESKLGKFWQDVKDMFGQSDTVNDRLKKAVEGKLTQQERIDLAKQEKEFHKKQMESLRSGLGWGAEAPDLADYPLIARRDQMLRDAEQNICKQVRSTMTAADKKELDDQFLQYAEATRTYRESPVFKLRQQPGQAIQNFYKSVSDAVENYGRQQAV